MAELSVAEAKVEILAPRPVSCILTLRRQEFFFNTQVKLYLCIRQV